MRDVEANAAAGIKETGRNLVRAARLAREQGPGIIGSHLDAHLGSASSTLACHHPHVSAKKERFLSMEPQLGSHVGNLKHGRGSELSLNSDAQHLGRNA